MTRRKLIIWGATGQALVIEEFIGLEFELCAVLDRDANRPTPFAGVPIFAGPGALEDWTAARSADEVWFVVAIGGGRGRDRCEVFERLSAAGLRAATLVHPTAFVAASARLGPGTVVLAQAAIGARAELGSCAIVNTAASVDHECSIGPGVHIGPGARLAGCVSVGAGTFVASGAIVAPRLRVGDDSIVGAGAVVVRDVPARVLVHGNPARFVRDLGVAGAAPLRNVEG